MRISHLDDSAALNSGDDKRIPSGLSHNKGFDHDADVVKEDQEVQNGKVSAPPQADESAHAGSSLTTKANHGTSVANQRSDLLGFDQSNTSLVDTNQSQRANGNETRYDEMDLDQVATVVQDAMQLPPDSPADKFQLLEDSQHGAQFAEDLRVKLILGNMVRALSANLNNIYDMSQTNVYLAPAIITTRKSDTHPDQGRYTSG